MAVEEEIISGIQTHSVVFHLVFYGLLSEISGIYPD